MFTLLEQYLETIMREDYRSQNIILKTVYDTVQAIKTAGKLLQ